MSNVKIHFAGAEQIPTWLVAKKITGVSYGLLTAYVFICQSLGLKSQLYFNKEINYQLHDSCRILTKYLNHCILDSGLFTLMFGAHGGKKSASDIETWFESLCEFISSNVPEQKISCVEVDCQKVLSPEAAWYYRKKMRALLPHHDIINVWHLEDGLEGFYRLIDFTNYIAISIPELRLNIKPSLLPSLVLKLCRIIHKRKPGLRIHLLGCTEKRLLLPVNHLVYSSDSTSWLSPVRFKKKTAIHKGIYNFRHQENTLEPIIRRVCAPEIDASKQTNGYFLTSAKWTLSMQLALNEYRATYGSQE